MRTLFGNKVSSYKCYQARPHQLVWPLTPGTGQVIFKKPCNRKLGCSTGAWWFSPFNLKHNMHFISWVISLFRVHNFICEASQFSLSFQIIFLLCFFFISTVIHSKVNFEFLWLWMPENHGVGGLQSYIRQRKYKGFLVLKCQQEETLFFYLPNLNNQFHQYFRN